MQDASDGSCQRQHKPGAANKLPAVFPAPFESLEIPQTIAR